MQKIAPSSLLSKLFSKYFRKRSASSETWTSTKMKTSSTTEDSQKSLVLPFSVPVRPQINVRMPPNVLLAWLDNNIDNNNEDCRNNITLLKRLVNSVETFIDRDQCVDFLTDNDDRKVILIISNTFSQGTIPLIHDIAHLHTIYIVCRNKKGYGQWVKTWSKIRDVFTDISSICDALRSTAQQCEQNDISISFVTTVDGTSTVLDRLDPAFMYSKILKEILLSIHFEEKHREEFLKCCQKMFNDNPRTLENVYKFVREYHDQTPIWWYTWDSFLYPMLNHALRTMNVDVMVQTGFFIADLHRHIEHLHSEQFLQPHFPQNFTVYRGQGLSKAEFRTADKNKRWSNIVQQLLVHQY